MLSITGQKRDVRGKKVKKARIRGLLPAVLYGPKEDAQALFVTSRDFGKLWKEAGETSVVSLSLPDNGSKDVLIHRVDFDPIKDEPIHVDFYAVEKGKAIDVHVPLVFTGVAPAVKELGGTIVKVLHEIEVSGQPQRIPHEVAADISALVDFESRITINDLSLPEGVTTLTEPHEIVAAVAAPKAEEEEAPSAADISQIEVEKRGKKEEEGASEEAE